MLPIQIIILTCVCCIVSFTPLTMYLFWLTSLNRGERPTVVDGTWDFIALLGGLIGFLLCGGVGLSLATSSLDIVSGGGFGQFWMIRSVHYFAWLFCTGGYLLFLTAAAAMTLRHRKHSLAIYNIELVELERSLQQTLTRLGFHPSRFGNVWRGSQDLVEVTPFHGLKHIQLRLLTTDPQLRQELEREIRGAMSRCHSPDNPAGTWIGTVAVTGFISVMVCVGLMFIAIFMSR